MINDWNTVIHHRRLSSFPTDPEKPEALAASEELAGGNKPRAAGDFYFSGSGSRVSRANFSSASLNQGAYAPTAMASRSSRQLAPGACRSRCQRALPIVDAGCCFAVLLTSAGWHPVRAAAAAATTAVAG